MVIESTSTGPNATGHGRPQSVILAPMSRSSKLWVWLTVIFGTVGVVLFLRNSEAERVEGNLRALAAALSFESKPLKPAWVATLRSSMAEHVANPVTVSVAPIGDRKLSADELTTGTLEYTSNFAAVTIRLRNIGVTIDPAGTLATAKGEAHLDILEPSNERRSEPRKFSATLHKNTDGWKVVHAQIEEPRIDEPEARP